MAAPVGEEAAKPRAIVRDVKLIECLSIRAADGHPVSTTADIHGDMNLRGHHGLCLLFI